MQPLLTRRQFFCGCCAMAACATLPHQALGLVLPQKKRTLNLFHTHTEESLKITYFEKGQYIPDALLEINHFLRDFRTGDVTEMDPGLLDQVCALHRRLKLKQPFRVISAYRSPQTNQMLRDKSKRVAEKSMHMEGRAIDLSLEKFSIKQLRNAALAMKAGGVGYYRKRFVHIDTGDIRKW